MMRVTSVQLRPDRPPVSRPPMLPGTAGALSEKGEEEATEAPARKKPKRPKQAKLPSSDISVAGKQVWHALTSQPLESSDTPAQPTWPEALAEDGESLYTRACRAKLDLAGIVEVLRALRLSVAAEVESEAWLTYLESKLHSAVRIVSMGHEDFAAEAEDFFAEARTRSRKRGRSGAPVPVPLKLLPRMAALDRLHFACWELGRRNDEKVEHPARLACLLEAVSLAAPGVADAIRDILSQQGGAKHIGRAWGVSAAWLRRRGSTKGKPWRRGANSLLQLLRARWCESTGVVVRAAAEHKLDAASPRTRSALLSWQSVGRDCGARWLAFAVPNAAALAKLARGARRSGLVELGAGNGYWAHLLAQQKIAVQALDVDPPSLPSPGAHVQLGTAKDLAGLKQETLLLCMPPPGEHDCSSGALEHFGGERVAYVGEWGSGMTGSHKFHEKLLQSFKLTRRVLLPWWPQSRIELFIFRRLAPGQAKSPAPTLLKCDWCGSSESELYRCPWSRQFCLCSEACYAKSEAEHTAVLRVCFCGAAVSSRPAFSEWEPCDWLEFGAPGSGRRWADLQAATPQAELRPKSWNYQG